jgi:hypothetical protein
LARDCTATSLRDEKKKSVAALKTYVRYAEQHEEIRASISINIVYTAVQRSGLIRPQPDAIAIHDLCIELSCAEDCDLQMKS